MLDFSMFTRLHL